MKNGSVVAQHFNCDSRRKTKEKKKASLGSDGDDGYIGDDFSVCVDGNWMPPLPSCNVNVVFIDDASMTTDVTNDDEKTTIEISNENDAAADGDDQNLVRFNFKK